MKAKYKENFENDILRNLDASILSLKNDIPELSQKREALNNIGVQVPNNAPNQVDFNEQNMTIDQSSVQNKVREIGARTANNPFAKRPITPIQPVSNPDVFTDYNNVSSASSDFVDENIYKNTGSINSSAILIVFASLVIVAMIVIICLTIFNNLGIGL